MSQSSVTGARKTFEVTTLGGETLKLQHVNEQSYYDNAKQKYLDEYTFTLANDFRSLDRLLAMEVQMHRCQWFTLAGMYYDGVDLDPKEEVELRRSMKELAAQITDLQSTLGVTKTDRDKLSEDSPGAYLDKLRIAAKAHGIMREKQLGKALELTKELFSLVGAFQRSNEQERRKLGFEGAQDIIDWVEQYMLPEFDAIDSHFRANEARFYRRSL